LTIYLTDTGTQITSWQTGWLTMLLSDGHDPGQD